MKFLIYGLNYSPELTGCGKFTGGLATWLAARGHEVRVVTAPPYHPNWHIDERYSGFRYRCEPAGGRPIPTVYRCPLWVPRSPRSITRLIHLCSFAVSSTPVIAIQAFWKPDIVFAVEPTFFAAPVALAVAAVSRATSWLHVQDFEVDAAFKLKFLPLGRRVQALVKGLERFCTGRFKRVSSISDKMVNEIKARGYVRSEVVLFPNWSDVEAVRPAERDACNSYREELGLTKKIVFLYSGNMGIKHGLDVLAPLAEALECDPRIHFLLCGDGVYRQELERLVRHRPNVTMLPLQAEDRLNDLLNAADIHLLPQERDAADLVMPSKLTGILASGRPVIATADEGTQVAEVVAGCGLAVPTGNAEALRAACMRLVEDVELRSSLGLAAREYAVEFLNKERVLRSFELEAMASLNPPEGPGNRQLEGATSPEHGHRIF